MSYFKQFPSVEYPFPDNVRRYFKNLSIRPTIHEDVYDAASLESYSIQDGETPETIAYDRYNDVNMHWIIMLVNNVLNIYKDWPKETSLFNEYIQEKYKNQTDNSGVERLLTPTEVIEYTRFVGTPNTQYTSTITRTNDPTFVITIKPPYFEDDTGEVFSYDTALVTRDAFGNPVVNDVMTPISYYEWERRLNDAKRNIWIPTEEIARKMSRQLRELVNE